MRASATVSIEACPQDVWDYFANVMNLERWVRGVSRVHLQGDALARQGLRFTSHYTYGGRTLPVEWEVAAEEPAQSLELHWTSGPFTYAGRLGFAEEGGGTRVEYTVDTGANGRMTRLTLGALGWPLAWLMSRQLRSDLKRARSDVRSAESRVT